MSTSLLYHAFGIRGYKYVKVEYERGKTVTDLHLRQKCNINLVLIKHSDEAKAKKDEKDSIIHVPMGSRERHPGPRPNGTQPRMALPCVVGLSGADFPTAH